MLCRVPVPATFVGTTRMNPSPLRLYSVTRITMFPGGWHSTCTGDYNCFPTGSLKPIDHFHWNAREVLRASLKCSAAELLKGTTTESGAFSVSYTHLTLRDTAH